MNEHQLSESATGGRLPPLIVTGGPAAGKTSTCRGLVEKLPRAAFIDADDIRQLVIRGAATAWEGEDGAHQMGLCARNVAALARNFHDDAFDVVIADVVDRQTEAIYRRHLPNVVIVHLGLSIEEAKRRAATRRVWLTDNEFEWLHRRDTEQPPQVDVRLDVEGLDLPGQVAAVAATWQGHSTPLVGGDG